MRLKRWLSAVLAFALALSLLAVPAFAATEEEILAEMSNNGAAWHTAKAAGDTETMKELEAANQELASQLGDLSFDSTTGTWSGTTNSGGTVSSSGANAGNHSSSITFAYYPVGATNPILYQSYTYSDPAIGAYLQNGGTTDELVDAYNNIAELMVENGDYGDEEDFLYADAEVAVAKAALGWSDEKAEEVQAELEEYKAEYGRLVTEKEELEELRQAAEDTGNADLAADLAEQIKDIDEQIEENHEAAEQVRLENGYTSEVIDQVIDGASFGTLDGTWSGVGFQAVDNKFQIVSACNEGGTISPVGTTWVYQGGAQTFTITPDEGYIIKRIVVDTVDVNVSTMTKVGNTYYKHANINALLPNEQYVPATTKGGQETYTFSCVKSNHIIYVEFEFIGVKITATATSGGTISPAGTTAYFKDETPRYTMTADEGCELVDVLVDGVSVFNEVNAYLKLASNAELRFDENGIISTSGVQINQKGDITVDGRGTIYADGTIDGQFMAYMSTPAGAGLVDMSGIYISTYRTGSTQYSGYTFAALTEDHTIHAVFDDGKLTITATAGPGGEIDPEGEIPVEEGEDKTFTITPDEGYVVDEVVVDGEPIDFPDEGGEYTFEDIDEDHTIDVTFKVKTFDIEASAGSGGSINPAGVVEVEYGRNRTFYFTPNSGYEIDKVYVDGTPVNIGSRTYYTFANVRDDHTIHVTFKPIAASSIDDIDIIVGGTRTASAEVNGDGYKTKSGYGINCKVGVTVTDATVTRVQVRNTATGNIFTLVKQGNQWVFPVNPDSVTGARVDYLPVALPDGNYRFEVVVTAQGDDGSTLTGRAYAYYTIDGVMYEDDFTGDR